MGNLQALGIQELTLGEQRALVGGDGMIAKVFGWLIGAVAGVAMNIADPILDAGTDFGNGLLAGYAEARG